MGFEPLDVEHQPAQQQVQTHGETLAGKPPQDVRDTRAGSAGKLGQCRARVRLELVAARV
jgi:hypothetical protein